MATAAQPAAAGSRRPVFPLVEILPQHFVLRSAGCEGSGARQPLPSAGSRSRGRTVAATCLAVIRRTGGE